jgi:hypothetical protein
MDGARGGEYYKSKPRWSSAKIYATGSPSSGLKRSILFLGILRGFLYIFCRKDQRSCNGWAAKLRRVQCSSEGCSLAQRVQRSSDRVQRSSDGVRRSSVECSIAYYGAA